MYIYVDCLCISDHNRMHAADVLHGVYYFTSQPIPGFEMLMSDPETPCAAGKYIFTR